MDVLQLLKDDNTIIRSLVARCLPEGNAAERQAAFRETVRRLGVHLLLEANYLYPEVRGLFPKSDEMVDRYLANHRAIFALTRDAADALKAGDEAGATPALAALTKAIEDHFADEEKNALPKIRQRMPTAAREELYEVFQDVKADTQQDGRGDRGAEDLGAWAHLV